jgi:hypothetical protein
MKTRSRISAVTLLRTVLAALCAAGTLLSTPALRAQSDDFNSGSDALWTKYDLSILGDPRVTASYTFPRDPTNGFAYRIIATGNPYYPTAGPGRAASYRGDVSYTNRFRVGVDLLAWNDAIDQDFGLLWYLSSANPPNPPGIGETDAYSVTYGPQDHLRISSISLESPTEIGRWSPPHLDPTQHYRLVASSHDGMTYLAQVFYTSDPNNPIASAITLDARYNSGFFGLVNYDGTSPSTTGTDVTYDNYTASVPAAGSLRTTVVDLYPPPNGKPPEFYPTISVGILDRDTTVDVNSILLWMDGTLVPSAAVTVNSPLPRPNNPAGYTGPYPGATVSYSNTVLLPPASRHTNSVAFMDNTATWQTNTWTWVAAYPFLYASNALPIGSLSMRGVDVRMVQTANGGVNLDNSLKRALQQLAIPPLIPYEIAATSIVQELAWNTTGTPTNVPGLCSTSNEVKNIAIEAVTYLELTSGLHRFHVITDDRAGFYSGTRLEDPNGVVLWEAPDNTANTTFDFIVEAPGLYPFRCIWEQAGGGAVLNLTSVNLADNSEVPINDPGNPVGVVHAWYPLACKSAAAATGPFVTDSTAANAVTLSSVLCNGSGNPLNQVITGGTFTIPASGTAKFYLLDGPRGTKITSIHKVGSNVVIGYQVP